MSFLFICFLLWSFHSNFAAALNAGLFQKPSSNSDARITAIQSELLKIQGEMLTLNTALESGDNSQNLKSRLSTLEGEFQSLREQLRDERRESTAANGKYDSSINVLTNYYNTLDTQLKALQKSMENKIQAETERQMPADVAEEIRSHRFYEAQALLLKMGDNNKIPKIVHDVYANSQANTNNLLDFAKASTNIDVSYHVLSALRYEMRANGHRDPYKMIALVNALEMEVIKQRKVSPYIKAKAQTVSNEIVADIKTVATEILKTAMYSDSYQKNVQVETLANAIYYFRSDVSDEVMQRVVSETFSTVSVDKIAENIYSNKYIPQIVAGLVALYRKLESADDLNNKVLSKIRYYLENLQGMTNYRNLSELKQKDVNSIMEKIPDCSKYVAFPPSICPPGVEQFVEYIPIVGIGVQMVKLFG